LPILYAAFEASVAVKLIRLLFPEINYVCQVKNTFLKVLYNIINWYTQRFRFPKKGWRYFKSLLRFFHLSGKTYKKKIFNGLSIYVNTIDHIQKDIFWYGYYEKNTILTWQTFVKEEATVLDIGANIGYYSLVAAKKATKGQVYSFEPVGFIRKQMQENISLNHLSNITVVPYCVSNETKVYDFFIAAENNIGMSGLQIPENFSGKKESVASVILDEWIKAAKINAVDLIKIDIEGAEKNALEGMESILQFHRPVFFIEIVAALLDKFNASVKDVYNIFSKNKYQAYETVKPNVLKPIQDFNEGYDIIFIPEGYKLPQTIKILI
jgi:FkbM family methyltransferase